MIHEKKNSRDKTSLMKIIIMKMRLLKICSEKLMTCLTDLFEGYKTFQICSVTQNGLLNKVQKGTKANNSQNFLLKTGKLKSRFV